MAIVSKRDRTKAALCGEPSYVWRAGQDRRLQMALKASGLERTGVWLENGCGVGMYIQHLTPFAEKVIGLEYDFERATEARQKSPLITNASGEVLPFMDGAFDAILSHEVLEHIQDDRAAVCEMVRVARPGGRIIIFVPNRWYPFETHGVYWKGIYHFGNIPLVNYLPRYLRDKLAPHVRAYTKRELRNLCDGLPVRVLESTVIFGAYDNIIARWPAMGHSLRRFLQFLEKTPFRIFGLSHFWVLEKDH